MIVPSDYMVRIMKEDDLLEPALREDPAANIPLEYASRLRPTQDCSASARELRNRVRMRLKSQTRFSTCGRRARATQRAGRRP